MGTKKKKAIAKKKSSVSSSKKAKAKKEDTTIPFQIWFSKKVSTGKLKFWQESEISIFFKEKGLSDKEEPDKYEECLKLY